MAKFIFAILKEGEDRGQSLSSYTTLSDIVFEEGDETVILPERYEGQPVTHIGFTQGFTKGMGEVCYDWHHPGKGTDYDPDVYHLEQKKISVPAHVKHIVLPKTVSKLAYVHKGGPFEGEGFTLSVHPDNPHLGLEDGKFIFKPVNRL